MMMKNLPGNSADENTVKHQISSGLQNASFLQYNDS